MVHHVLSMYNVLYPILITESGGKQAFKGYILSKSPNIIKINQDVLVVFVHTVKSFLPERG